MFILSRSFSSSFLCCLFWSFFNVFIFNLGCTDAFAFAACSSAFAFAFAFASAAAFAAFAGLASTARLSVSSSVEPNSEKSILPSSTNSSDSSRFAPPMYFLNCKYLFLYFKYLE